MRQLLDYMFACSNCGSDKTYIRKSGVPQWRINKETGKRYCKKCFNKLFDNHKYAEVIKQSKKQYYKRVLRFRGREIGLFEMRTGICSLCGQKRMTQIHHWNYVIIFPWFATQELCVPCHNKQRIGSHYDKVLIV